jgi:methionyl-tRNA synthetase
MTKQLVTMALPYANGSIHLGHLVEAVQTDVYVRALKAMGEDVIYVCADDTHGTPIEVNAAKAGIPPEQFVARFHQEHLADYTAFEIAFDEFYTTHSPENEKHAGEFFAALTKAGAIDKRAVEQLYCEVDKRFLPDRFVRGTCPVCKTANQYGDACESCGSTYDPTELLQPFCSICKDQGRGEVPPVKRLSDHYFVRLSLYQSFLKEWTASPGRLQPEIVRSLDKWLTEPLKDWDVSRDAPYFGFKIPGEESKYFYVWLDAPIGYLSSTEHWCKTKPSAAGRRVEDYWAKSADAEITHFIGKDIVYFHTLFWPAMLEACGRKVPKHVHVHGMLTVEGTKMSKSRGTFINAREYLDAGFDVEWLRYFYAANLGPHPSDIDLSLNELKNRVNGELLNNIGNLANRALSVLWKSFGGKLASLKGWTAPDASAAWGSLVIIEKLIADAYRNCDTRAAIQQILSIGSLANERLQRVQPWKLLKENPDEAQRELTFAINIARTCARWLAPIVPAFAQGIATQSGAALLNWNDDARWAFHDTGSINEPKPLVRKVEDAELAKLGSRFVAEDKKPQSSAPASDKAAAPKAQSPKPKAPPEPPKEIPFETFAAIDLRAGKILEATRVPKADKLLQLTVDLGEGAPRTILSGIAESYSPEELVGKTVAVVANLGKKPLRGIESHGMILAASGGARGLTIIELPGDVTPGARVK